MQDYILKLEEKISETNRRIRKIIFLRNIFIFSFFSSILIFIIYSILKIFLSDPLPIQLYYIFVSIIVLLGIIVIALHILYNLLKINLEESERRIETKKILEKQNENQNKDNEDNTSNYFNSLVEINIDNLSSYYILVKQSASKSFYISIIAGFLGYILISLGLIFGFVNDNNNQKYLLSYLSVASGVITEFISGTFFYLYNKTVRQMKEYHDSLVSVQNILLSFKLIQDTKEPEQRTKLTETIIQYLTVPNHHELKNK